MPRKWKDPCLTEPDDDTWYVLRRGGVSNVQTARTSYVVHTITKTNGFGQQNVKLTQTYKRTDTQTLQEFMTRAVKREGR